MNKLTASIVITTKDRKEDLAGAIESSLHQKGEPEIFVFDDGSDDGTSDFIRAAYPAVKLHREEHSSGLIAARNKAASMATGDIIFSIDDDAAFSDDTIVEEILNNFTSPRIGAVAIPHIDINRSPNLLHQPPDDTTPYITSEFTGTAHALRKDIFLRLNGYRNYFFRQCEEMDYCIRMLNLGYYVRLGTSKPIIHYESPKRDQAAIKFYAARNNVLFTLQNVPRTCLFFHMAVNMFNLIRHHEGYLIPVSKGILTGLKDFFQNKNIVRSPVNREAYHLFREMRKKQAIALSEAPVFPDERRKHPGQRCTDDDFPVRLGM
jgi:glycosyltransferase involved in cell wall biosynthesis